MKALTGFVFIAALAAHTMCPAATPAQIGTYVGSTSGQQFNYATGEKRSYKRIATLTIFANDTYNLSTEHIKTPQNGDTILEIIGYPAVLGAVDGAIYFDSTTKGAGQLHFLPNGKVQANFTIVQTNPSGFSVSFKMNLKKQGPN
jgi:hypothetical protein